MSGAMWFAAGALAVVAVESVVFGLCYLVGRRKRLGEWEAALWEVAEAQDRTAAAQNEVSRLQDDPDASDEKTRSAIKLMNEMNRQIEEMDWPCSVCTRRYPFAQLTAGPSGPLCEDCAEVADDAQNRP